MSPEDPNFNILRTAFFVALATVGGFIGHIMRTIDSRVKIQWINAIIQGIGAGFVGLLVLFLCDANNFSDQWTGLMVGVCGWLGANASIRVLEAVVFKRLGLVKPSEPVRGRQDDQ